MIDCHVHTARCGHGEGSAAEYVAAARSKGLDVITFTEHLPLPADLDPINEYAMPEEDLGEYIAEVAGLAGARDAADGHGMKVFTGVEADWLPERLDHVRRLLATQEFDVVMGSVHFVDGWAFDDPALIDRWESADVDVVWERYFELLMNAAASGLFNVMAHPDLAKKFGYRPSFDPRELYEHVAESFAHAGVAIEVSTAGLRKPVGELYPGPDLLAAFARAGVPATIGSDAHRPSEVGFAYDAAATALTAAGYDRVVYFDRRQPRECPL